MARGGGHLERKHEIVRRRATRLLRPLSGLSLKQLSGRKKEYRKDWGRGAGEAWGV